MKGVNKQLTLPTLLFGVILVSALILQKSSAISPEVIPELRVELPTNLDRVVVVTEAVPSAVDLKADETNSVVNSLEQTPTIDSNKTQAISTPSNTDPIKPTDPLIIVEPQSTAVMEKAESTESSQTIEATLVIQGPGISLKRTMEFDEEPSVYALLKQASKTFDFSLKVSQHSSLGMFVEGIAGVKNDPKTDRYWLYYVNGQFASRGVSSQIVKEGDLIKWSYE